MRIKCELYTSKSRADKTEARRCEIMECSGEMVMFCVKKDSPYVLYKFLKKSKGVGGVDARDEKREYGACAYVDSKTNVANSATSLRLIAEKLVGGKE